MRRSIRAGSDPVASAALARAPAALPSQTKRMNPAALVQKMRWTDDMEAFLVKAWQKIVEPTGGKGKTFGNLWRRQWNRTLSDAEQQILPAKIALTH